MVYHTPYSDEEANRFYNLVFCDSPELFFPTWSVGELKPIFTDPFNERAVRALAENDSIESRMRAMAYARLRYEGRNVPQRRLFGAIVEAMHENGLQTLAAYTDGRVRYITGAGKLVVIEQDATALRQSRQAFLRAAQEVVDEIAPTTQPRLAPPQRGDVRLSFVVSDGLYVGEANLHALSGDPLGGPILQAATDLMNATIAFATEKAK